MSTSSGESAAREQVVLAKALAEACARFDGTTLSSWRDYTDDTLLPLIARHYAAREREVQELVKAGAREWLKAHSVAASYADAIATTVSQIAEWMVDYAAQQTAAKDAQQREYHDIANRALNARDDMDAERNRQQVRAEAAERERDSLREANARTRSIIEALRDYMIKQQINEPYTIQELNRADAALKAGKDGQQ